LRSVQGRLLDFFERLAFAGEPRPPVTAGAWSQARAKLRHTAFIELNEGAVLASCYAPDNAAPVRRWRGHRLCASDGSLVQRPESAALGQQFGWEATANGRGPGAVRHVQARASVYYDLLNPLALEARLEPGRTAERALGAVHLGAVRPGDVVLTDRGYCGLEWFGRVQAAGADFVCRGPRHWRPEADARFKANPAGVSRTVELKLKGRRRQRLRPVGLSAAGLAVRLVTLRLSTMDGRSTG
jgi:hypothetical protein